MPITNPNGLNQAALERLYARLERPLYNVVYRWLWNAEEAQDIVQEAFMRVWDRRASVDMATVEPLLYRTALNLASNRRRARKLWRWVSIEAWFEPASPRGGADAAMSTAQQDQAVRNAVESLPEHLRQVVALCELSGLSYEQVGALLSIPSGTVGSRRNKAMRLLRQSLGPLAEDGDESEIPVRV